MKPLIGITGRKDTSARLHNSLLHSVGESYVRAIHEAGGVPVILPPVMHEEDCEVLTGRLNGLMLTGGEDVSPVHYGQEPESWMGGVDEARDISEFNLLQWALDRELPILGICRGHQIMNIALGGTLYQDLAAQVPGSLDHAYAPARPMEQYVHAITVEAESKIATILKGTEFMVNSAHHQAIKTLGKGMHIVACAPDGIIEAIEMPDYPFCLSVQWHPEAMIKTDPAMRFLFEALITAATKPY